MGMSILPKWHDGRVCIPWWYGLGYPLVWMSVGICIGISRSDNMIAITTETLIVMAVCALLGAFFYVAFNALSKWEKQKTDAVKIKDKIASSGRDPTDLEAMTPTEKWEITKVQKFDRLFLIVDALLVLLSAGLTVAGVYWFGDRIHLEAIEEFAIASFLIAVAVAFFLDMTLIKNLGTVEWEKKKQDAFQLATTAIAEAAPAIASSRMDELIQKYLDAGFTKREAKKLAQQKLADEIE